MLSATGPSPDLALETLQESFQSIQAGFSALDLGFAGVHG